MRTLTTLFFIGVFAAPAAAQWGGQGVPPGQLPPPGLCRVWYEGTPPGRQPRPMNCDQAERVASRDRRARVIYGEPVGRRNDRDWGRNDRSNGRWGRNDGRFLGVRQIALDNGFRDGYEKGREDARDDDRYDPVRHSWYRSANRGYDNDYGSRDVYRNVYREGFERGYAQGYREHADRDDRRRGDRTAVRRWP